MSLRLESQHCLATITLDGEIIEEFPIEEFNVDLQISVEETRYVGENAPRFREVFGGAQFTASGHAEGSSQTKGVLALYNAVMARSRAQSVGTKINFVATLVWPNGDQRNMNLPDCAISNPKVAVRGSNSEMVGFSFEGQCSNPAIVA